MQEREPALCSYKAKASRALPTQRGCHGKALTKGWTFTLHDLIAACEPSSDFAVEPPVELNADFTQRVAMHGATLAWVNSPMPGVHRRMLDRVGAEVARATSIVRYAPSSQFSAHVHTGGEEFIVLEGVFQDEHGDFPEGSYIRNPPQSRHTPGSAPGCTIMVKLWQFDLTDRTHVRTHVDKVGRLHDPSRDGVGVAPLFEDAHEQVRVEWWDAGAQVPVDAHGGAEVFVLDGSFEQAGEAFQIQSWLRMPTNSKLVAKAGAQGAKVWIKSGHLRPGSFRPLDMQRLR